VLPKDLDDLFYATNKKIKFFREKNSYLRQQITKDLFNLQMLVYKPTRSYRDEEAAAAAQKRMSDLINEQAATDAELAREQAIIDALVLKSKQMARTYEERQVGVSELVIKYLDAKDAISAKIDRIAIRRAMQYI